MVTTTQRAAVGAATALLLLLGMNAAPRQARAQDVRHSNSGWGLTMRAGDNAAEEAGRGDWPRIRDGVPGTQVHVAFDLNNADVTLVTGRAFGEEPLLAEARRVADALEMPEADYITHTGKKGVYADIEFNDYLKKTGRTQTTFDLDLAALGAALRASRLPRPVVLIVKVDRDEAETATLAVPGAAERALGETTFFGLDEIPEGARLRWSATVPWYGYAVALLLMGMALMPGTMPWKLARMQRKARQEQAEKERAGLAAETVPDPTEVQAQYNKGPAQWVFLVGIPLLMVPLFLTGLFMRVLSAGFLALESLNIPMVLLPVGMMAAWGGSSLACWLAERARDRRERREGTAAPAPAADPDAPPQWTQTGSLYPMIAVILLVLLIGPFGLLDLPAQVRLYLLFGGVAAALVGTAVMVVLARRATYTRLKPGDVWHDRVQERAAQAGVRVRKVELQRSSMLNAYVTPFGTVGLTSALLRRLEPEEVEVVVAHELGHHKSEHAGRSVLLSLAVSGVLLAAWWFARDYLRDHYKLSKEAQALLSSPMFVIFVLPLLRSFLTGRASRKHEEAADRFAVDATGDAERVIHTLRKLHTLNGTPHYLRPADEAISTHPSLANRIEAIRRYAEGRPAAG